MRQLAAAAILVSGLVSSACGRPYDYGFDAHEHLVRRAAGHGRRASTPFVVTGIGSGGRNATAALPARLEIRQMETNADLWTLYILGLSMMQYTDQAQLLSYYQIAGIHGVPWTAWNGVSPVPGSENTGYCMHISELFLTWHRPYLALYEQVLFSLIQFIAPLYPDDATRARYQKAAASFRIPYWDWAAQPPAGKSVLPESVGGSALINVTGPNGAQVIANPLYTYLFKPLNATMFIEAPYDLWRTTVRAPTTDDETAGSNNTAVSLALNQNFPSIQQRLYNLFSNYQNYSTFSNEAWIPDTSNGKDDSLESLHDTIHTLSGLNGHMAWIPFSAFDPIFFLHHCMVDRVFALWQVLNPDSWVLPTSAAIASYTTADGQIQDAQTALTPFYKTRNGTFWTSDDVRDMGVFGYTYDDMAGIPRASLTTANATAQAQVAMLINRLYGASSPATLGLVGSEGGEGGEGGDGGAAKRTVRRGREPQRRWTDNRSAPSRDLPAQQPPHRRQHAPWSPPAQAKPAPASVVVDNQYREWVVNIHVEKQALNASFFIDLFLGDPPADASTWAYAPNLVGTMSVFAAPGGAAALGPALGPGGGGGGGGSGHTSGTVPLTSALAQAVGRGALAGLDPEVAEPFLRAQLRCGVVTADGAVVAPAEVGGLGITVVSSCVQVPATAGALPRWGDVEDAFVLV